MIQPQYSGVMNFIRLAYGYEGNIHWCVNDNGINPTAYVELPDNLASPARTEDWEDNVDIHGGVTFDSQENSGEGDDRFIGVGFKNHFIGWDYAHLGDAIGGWGADDTIVPQKRWTTEEIIEEVKQVILSLQTVSAIVAAREGVHT
jgi:hypothetical protein